MSKPHPLLDRRLAGVLLHPTSLPARPGSAAFTGDLGPTARDFTDWLGAAGFGLWQMLPIGPVGKGDSPYSSLSSFAIEPMLISLSDLAADGYISEADARIPRNKQPKRNDRANHAAARRFKQPRLKRAYERFCSRRSGRAAFDRFQRDHAHWLGPWCEWIAEREDSDPDQHAFIQFLLDTQWQRLRKHARRSKVHLVGDLPIFVGDDSADVDSNPELFRLDRHGRPTVVTGVPPDPFGPNGQLWGHPHYQWSAHRRTGFKWWCDRVKTSVHRFDLMRIDHFVGFVHAYEVSARARTARHGHWKKTPGRELLTAIQRSIGSLPFIAEDLGNVTPAVDKMREEFHLPGMRILQWAFFNPESSDLPHNHPKNAVVYPGTHDNDTTLGWWKSLPALPRKRFLAYGGAERTGISSAMNRLAITSPANTAIIQAQDILGLGRSSRMNRPGIPLGNWRWRLAPGQPGRKLALALHDQLEASGRLPK